MGTLIDEYRNLLTVASWAAKQLRIVADMEEETSRSSEWLVSKMREFSGVLDKSISRILDKENPNDHAH